MKKVLKTIVSLCLIGILLYVVFHREQVLKFFVVNFDYKKQAFSQEANEYKKDLSISFVQETDNFFPRNKQDILNIFYTSLNNGVDEFTYYCIDEYYPNCQQESKEIMNDSETLSIVNNLVHPYNSYKNLTFEINSLGKIKIIVDKQYTEKNIQELNQKVDEILKSEITDTMSLEEKIKKIHDYIINHSVYDKEKADAMENNNQTQTTYESDTAMGVLFHGYGICSGFSDAMELFLFRFGVENYKISSPTHIWNLVHMEDGWRHLDLTWDNPIVNTGEKLLLHDFFLIDTKSLKDLNTSHHNYPENIYQEAK